MFKGDKSFEIVSDIMNGLDNIASDTISKDLSPLSICLIQISFNKCSLITVDQNYRFRYLIVNVWDLIFLLFFNRF